MSRAAVDIGTNSVRLLIVDEAGGELVRRVEVVGLGRGVDATGLLAPDAVERTVTALSRFGGLIRSREVASVRAVATSASRDAGNAEEFLDRAEAALGLRPEVVAGEEEAALALAGVRSSVPGDGPILVIDPGGGSTEFVFGSDRVEYVTSVDIGSVRLTDRALPGRPPRPGQMAAAQQLAAEALGGVAPPGSPAVTVGVAGTFTSLAAMHLSLDAYDRDRVHGAVLGAADIGALVDVLATMTVAETEAIPSLDPARAPVILAGAVVVREAMRSVGADEVTISESDMLEGILLSL